MILCVNANAAIDKTLVVRRFQFGALHRTESVLATAGGKGANVARALRTLGEPALLTGWVGGFAGGFIEARLRAEGIDTAFVRVEGESRTCTTLIDSATGTLTEINERGEPIAADALDALIALFTEQVARASFVVLSGSLPPGAPPDLYARLIAVAHAAGTPVALDTSGEPLQHGLSAQPALIKPNQHEFAVLLGRTLDDEAGYIAAARRLSQSSGVAIALSLGAKGALFVRGEAAWRALPPPIDAVSAVGSGDCLLAGLLSRWSRGESPADALRAGVAAGTANALSLGAGHFTREDYDRVYAGVRVEEVA